MNNFTFGEVFESDAPRPSRPSRSTAQYRISYNEDLMSPNPEGDDGDAHPSSFPCFNFLSDAGILDDFLLLINRVGLTDYVADERDQYALLTKIFVESFKFINSHYNSSVAFKIYDKSITMSLGRFCSILGIPMFGTAKKIQNHPADLVELYRGVTNDDDRNAQRGKIRNIQLPAIRYFTYYLATSVLGRENTSNISNYHLAFLATALDVGRKYNLGAVIARRLAARGPIYGGIIAARIVAELGLSIAPNDVLLAPQRLDLAAMKLHHFVTANSCAGKLVYRMLFTDGEEREIPFPQPNLFSIHVKPWSRTKVELDDQLRLLGFNIQHGVVVQEEEEEPAYHFTTYHSGGSSNSYQDDGASSSHYGGATSFTSWPSWD
jgi:hypothetical protein